MSCSCPKAKPTCNAAGIDDGTISVGNKTLKVPVKMFADNRKRLIEQLKSQYNIAPKSFVLLQGGEEINIYDTDVNYPFKQESYFMWTFGVLEPKVFGMIDLDTTESTLFVPEYPEEYAVWMGPIKKPDFYKKKYRVNNVKYLNKINEFLDEVKPSTILILDGVNSDSGLNIKLATFEGIENYNVDREMLFNSMAELRVIKSKDELNVLRYVCAISSAAHRKVMRGIKPGMSEFQCESMFLDYCYSVGGCRNVSYTCICGSGNNSAVLHYGHAAAPNDKEIANGDMCLFDMGGNYMGYAADITCSFPCNGKFTPDQKMIYEAVLAANVAVAKAAKPGVLWSDMHRLAEKQILTHLKNGGLVTGDVEEMLSAGLGAIFMPHGLGHFMGLDVHDVGGYLSGQPERPTQPGLKCLRTARMLQPGMVLTIEPGCYFIEPLIEKALNDEKLKKFMVKAKLEKFKNFGGVRIEDDVIITETGIENMTKVPRTVEEIERWMAGLDDHKYD